MLLFLSATIGLFIPDPYIGGSSFYLRSSGFKAGRWRLLPLSILFYYSKAWLLTADSSCAVELDLLTFPTEKLFDPSIETVVIPEEVSTTPPIPLDPETEGLLDCGLDSRWLFILFADELKLLEPKSTCDSLYG